MDGGDSVGGGCGVGGGSEGGSDVVEGGAGVLLVPHVPFAESFPWSLSSEPESPELESPESELSEPEPLKSQPSSRSARTGKPRPAPPETKFKGSVSGGEMMGSAGAVSVVAGGWSPRVEVAVMVVSLCSNAGMSSDIRTALFGIRVKVSASC